MYLRLFFLPRPPFSSGRGSFLALSAAGHVHLAQVWAPAGLRGARPGRSKWGELVSNHGIAFRRARASRDNGKKTFQLFFSTESHGNSTRFKLSPCLYTRALQYTAAVACLWVAVFLWVMISPQKKQKTVCAMKIKMRCTETPGNRLTHSPPKKNFERSPRELQIVLGSSSNLDDRFRTAFLCRRSSRVLAKSARTKR